VSSYEASQKYFISPATFNFQDTCHQQMAQATKWSTMGISCLQQLNMSSVHFWADGGASQGILSNMP
jgi:hypothetical protein